MFLLNILGLSVFLTAVPLYLVAYIGNECSLELDKLRCYNKLNFIKWLQVMRMVT